MSTLVSSAALGTGAISDEALGHGTVLRFEHGTPRARDLRTRGRTMRPDELERHLRERLDALGPAPRAELLHVLTLPDAPHLPATDFL